MAGNLTAMIAAIFSGSAVSTDPYFNLTTLLLSTTATNGQQNNTFQDSSTNNFTIARNPATGPNAPTQGTFSPFSQTGWSNYFSSANISCPNINFSTNSFCIEGWFYPVELSSANINFWGTDNGASTNPKMIVYISSGNITVDMGNAGTTQFPISVSTSFLSANAWNHIAVVREGLGTNQLKMYINGTMRGSGQLGTNISNITAAFNIGYIGEAFGTKFPGYISNFRIVNGSPVYTADFTPSTTPLTAITNTVLLTCQANRFVDSNTQVAAKTITLTGTPTVVPFSPFNPTSAWSASTVGGSGYFDGTGDYLSIAANAQFLPGANVDFSFEAWVYLTATPSASGAQIVGTGEYGSNADWTLTVNSSLQPTFYINKPFTVTSSKAIALNSWNHIQATRSGTATNNVKLFLNGEQVGQGTETGTLDYNGNNLTLGGDANGDESVLTGYISGVRLINGTGYTSVTVPTAPPTAITNTVLLLNFTNAGIYDATAKNVLETVGTAQASTTQAKFGTTSMYFDGTTTPEDLLSTPVLPYSRIGAGDYTLEMWIRPSRVNTLQALLTYGSTAFRIFLNSSNIWFLNSGTSIVQYNSVVTTANQWYYLVLVRKGSSGTNCAIFLDGTRLSTGFTNTTDFNTGTPNIGGEGASNLYQGYMQDFRLTRFARYDPANSTITVPTAAFPVQ